MMPWYWVRSCYDRFGALLVGQQVLREAVVRGQRLEAGGAQHADALAGTHEVSFAAAEVFEAQEREGQELYLRELCAPT